MDREGILAGVVECVAESLSKEKGALTADSRMVADLNADSLDFLDIMFALETRFQIKLEKKDFNLVARLGLKPAEAVAEGKLTAAAREKLKAWLPALPVDQELAPQELGSYLTIQTLVLIVEDALGRKA